MVVVAKASSGTYNLKSLTKILGMKLQCRLLKVLIQVITELHSQNMVPSVIPEVTSFQR